MKPPCMPGCRYGKTYELDPAYKYMTHSEECPGDSKDKPRKWIAQWDTAALSPAKHETMTK